jgi:hypothetical protein
MPAGKSVTFVTIKDAFWLNEVSVLELDDWFESNKVVDKLWPAVSNVVIDVVAEFPIAPSTVVAANVDNGLDMLEEDTDVERLGGSKVSFVVVCVDVL